MKSTAAPGPALSIRALSRAYGHTWALRNVSLDVRPRETLAVVGPSGSGKSTLLRICAGVVAPSSGSISFDGKDITEEPPERRGFGVVFQAYALFPHLTVAENVAFALRTKRYALPRPEVPKRVAEMLDLVRLTGLGHRRPSELSGGQEQRVALARALAPRPQMLLLDEPMGALDAALKDDLQADLARVRAELGIGMIYITHDREEAAQIADVVAVLRDGQLEQCGALADVHARPRSAFVARILGATNSVSGCVTSCDGTTATIATENGAEIRGWANNVVAGQLGTALVRNDLVEVGVATNADDGRNRICSFLLQRPNRASGSQVDVTVQGKRWRISCRVRELEAVMRSPSDVAILTWPVDQTHIFAAEATS